MGQCQAKTGGGSVKGTIPFSTDIKQGQKTLLKILMLLLLTVLCRPVVSGATETVYRYRPLSEPQCTDDLLIGCHVCSSYARDDFSSTVLYNLHSFIALWFKQYSSQVTGLIFKPLLVSKLYWHLNYHIALM